MIDRFVIKRNDRREPIARTLKASSGLPQDLGSATSVYFRMRPETGGVLKVNAPAAIIAPPESGNVQYNWAAGDTDTAGYYQAEWEVTYQDGTKQSFPNGDSLLVHVREDLG